MTTRRLQKSNAVTCAKKRAYRNEASVSVVADSIGMEFYKCTSCGFWHLTRRRVES